MISRDLLLELKNLFKEEFGITLTDAQTTEIAIFLVTWFSISTKILKN